ncbi:hypothetical protein THAOC_14886, partial [Thalassiosira oceanica]
SSPLHGGPRETSVQCQEGVISGHLLGHSRQGYLRRRRGPWAVLASVGRRGRQNNKGPGSLHGEGEGGNMSSEQPSKKLRSGSGAASTGGEAATIPDLCTVVAAMKSQLESFREWKVSAEERLERLESQNELLGRRCGRLEEERDAALSQLSATSAAVESIKAGHDRLKQLCDYVDNKCSALQESLSDSVLRDPDWVYPEPDPDINFEELGFGEDGNPFTDIRDAVISLWRDTQEKNGSRDIKIGDEDDPPIPDGIREMSPHWRQLLKAIRLRYPMGQVDKQVDKYAKKPSISIENISWSAVMGGDSDLARALAFKNFGKLTLRNNGFRQGMCYVLSGLENVPNLNELVWVRNEISNPDRGDWGRLIKDHRGLTSITISSSCTDSDRGTSLLRVILNASICNANLTKIDLASNNIETGGSTFLSDYISKDTPLRVLSLKGNNLNDNDTLQIALALKKNHNLMELNLESNEITNEGYSAIRRSIWAEGLTFNEIYHCNHVCCLIPFAEKSYNTSNIKSLGFEGAVQSCGISDCEAREYAENAAEGNYCRKIAETVRNKISENSLVSSLQSEFGEDAFKLVPYILESILWCCKDYWENTSNRWSRGDKKGALEVYFDILRGWMMPEMYGRGAKQ